MVHLLTDVVRAEAALNDLRAYFADSGTYLYTGRRFEALAGGGDRAETHDTITADDLVAVQMLSVRVPAPVALHLLEGQLGTDVARLLTQIPADSELGKPGAEKHVGPESAADEAWKLLVAQDGVNYVIAGKLLARKRPHLIPVYDQVVACLFGKPKNVWLRLHDALANDKAELRTELAALRDRAGLPAGVSLIRVLDVVLWMSHRDHVRRGACAGSGSVILP